MKLKSLLILLASAGLAQSATISVVRSGNGVVGVTSTGTVLSTGGYYIGVGSYGDTAPTITDDATFLTALASFKEFASATSPTTGGTVGTITGSFASNGGATPADFNAKTLYILVGNAASRAASTEFALIQGTPSWSFVGDVTIGSASATISLVDSTAFSVVGVAGTEIDQATGQDRIQMRAVIPEPSSILLGLLGLGLIARRKR